MQLQRLEETAAASSAELVQLDEQRSVVKARLEEARVGILLGEGHADEQVSVNQERLTDLDARISETRERASIEQAAVRRIQERGVAIESRIRSEYKGYGFIRPSRADVANGQQVFFHISVLHEDLAPAPQPRQADWRSPR